jgi:hypothetical protein
MCGNWHLKLFFRREVLSEKLPEELFCWFTSIPFHALQSTPYTFDRSILSCASSSF